ncbi:MAG: Ig-like domain repeat protein [Anaerolineales bacterium]|nr:Ig-like domain repeat protein [Anaerolineales bacterium]
MTATPLISSTFTVERRRQGPRTPLVTMDVTKAITATFTLKTYVITPDPGANGTITLSTPQTVNYGNDKTFTIAATPHYHILDVAADGVSVGAVTAYTFTNVTANHIITAAFAIDTHTLTVIKTGAGAGAILQEPAGAVFDFGTVVTLTATTVPTSTFTGWSGDATGTTNPLPITIDGDKVITGTFIIHQLPTTTTLQSSRNPAFVYDNIEFSVQVEEILGPFGVLAAAGPTGQIDLSDTTGAISLTGSLVDGGVQLNTSTLAAGSYTVTAAYSGDTYHEPSVSNLVVQMVNKHRTTTHLRVVPNPVLVGDQVFMTATVAWDDLDDAAGGELHTAGAGPTGQVDFMADGTLIARALVFNGVADHCHPDLCAKSEQGGSTRGLHRHRPVHTGGLELSAGNLFPGRWRPDGLVTATVQSTVDLGYQPGIYSQADSSTAALIPTGDVIFAENGVEFGRGQLENGVATFRNELLPVGVHTITAEYLGDANFLASISAPYLQTVQPLPTARNDAAGGLEDTTVMIPVLANDLDPAGGGLVVGQVGPAAHGQVVIDPSQQTVTYTPDPGFHGVDSFTYVAVDKNGATDDALVAVVVPATSEADTREQVALTDPTVDNTAHFTSTAVTVTVDVPTGFYTGQPGDKMCSS